MQLKHAALSLLLITGCLTEDDELALDTADQEVSNGTLIADASSVGAIQLLKSGAFICSGTMIAPDWALTAGHCAAAAGDTVRLGNANDAAAQVTTVDRVIPNPAMDLALLKLKRALDVQGRSGHYKLSLFPDLEKTLLGKSATFYGSSQNPSPSCVGLSCGFGYLRSALVNVNITSSHNIGGTSSAAAVAGDSGGGLIYQTAAGRELAGVLKCGFSSCLVRPEAFRRWALSYLYDRAVELPDIWNYGENSGHFFAVPLQDSYVKEVTWDVCPGSASWRVSASYSLEPGYDFIDLISSTSSYTLNGNGMSIGLVGSGPLRIRVRTDGSVRSTGLQSMSVKCNRGLEFPNPWGTPSPAGTSGIQAWDPCPGGAPWTWTADHSYGANGIGQVGSRVFSGTGITTGTATGETFVSTYTPIGGSAGLRSLTAKCNLALQCHGTTCFARGETNVPTTANITLDPCNGRPFDLKFTAEFLVGDRITIGGTTYTSTYPAWRTFNGPTPVSLYLTQPSTVRGIPEMTARCLDWGADRTSFVNVVSGTYGRNCRVNKDNATQRLDYVCKGQPGSCSFPIRTSDMGDPAVGCAKDFTAEWTCGSNTTVKKLVVSGEADGKTANLVCP